MMRKVNISLLVLVSCVLFGAAFSFTHEAHACGFFSDDEDCVLMDPFYVSGSSGGDLNFGFCDIIASFCDPGPTTFCDMFPEACGPSSSGGGGGGGGGTVDACQLPGVTCPPPDKTCADGSVIPVTSECTHSCPDGSVIPETEQCPPTPTVNPTQDPNPTTVAEKKCEDPKANNPGGPLPCTYPDNAVTVTDACPNISGTQAGVPLGMGVDNNGNCVPNSVVYCNDPAAINWGYSGICSYPPAAPVVSGTDMCGNFPGTQASVPNGMVRENGDCVFPSSDDSSGSIGGTGNGGSMAGSASGFTLDGDALVAIRFLANLGGETVAKAMSVTPFGGFARDVVVSVQSNACASPAKYSFDGGAYTDAPQATMSADGSGRYKTSLGTIGLPVKIKFAKSFSQPCDITFIAAGAGSSDPHVLRVAPSVSNPDFKEF